MTIQERKAIEGARRAFTLVELLVVITIIAILLALVAGATLRFIGVQQQTNSEVVVRKVNEVFQRQWRAVIDQASKEPLPPSSPALGASYNVVLNLMAGGDPNLARVIWVKMRLRQEFPMSFDEVLGISQNTPSPPLPLGPILPPLPEYVMALAPLIASAPTPPPPYPPSVFQWYTWEQQNSALLLLALTRSRGGVSLNLDDLGSDSTSDLIPPQPSPGLTQLPQGLLPNVRIIVDAWKQPVVFFRWASSNNELDNLNPASPGSAATIFRDPQDPKGLLLNPSWWSGNSRQIFELYCHPLFTVQAAPPQDGRPYLPPPPNPAFPAGTGPYPGTPYPYYVWGYEYYMEPVVASAGKNKRFGFGLATPSGPLTGPPYLAPLPWNQLQLGQLAAWYGMNTDGTGDDTDNIYSYRLR